MTLKRVAIAFLILMVGWNIFKFAPSGGVAGVIGANLFDVRVLVLAVGIAVLHYRENKTPAAK